MRRGIDATRKSAGDGESCVGKLVGKFLRAFGGIVGWLSRADDSDGVRVS